MLVLDSNDGFWEQFQRQQQRSLERSAEILHEQQVADIRTASRALVWTGPVDELTATIARWHESGWLPGVTLQDCLRMVSPHIVGPNGMPAIRLRATTPEVESAEVFSHSPNYQKIAFRGQTFDLTSLSYAPLILKVLHESHLKGEYGMTTNQIRKRAKLPNNGKMYDWFRGTGLWKHLVITVGKDLYRLDIPVHP